MIRLIRLARGVLCLIWVLSLSHEGGAAARESTWSVSPVLGIDSPALHLLNEGEFKAPLPVQGGLTFQSEGVTQDVTITITNPLESIEFGTEAGIEFQKILDGRNAMLFGISNWEGVSTSIVQTTLPFQGTLSEAAFERTGNISYTQFYLGWQRELIRRPKRFRLHTRLIIRELFDVDYKEDLTFNFKTGPGATFQRNVAMKSQATGIIMAQFGLGSEVFLRKWLSLGVDAGYSLGARRFNLNNISTRSDFQRASNTAAADNVTLTLPLRSDSQGNVLFLSGDGATFKELKLGFDGWNALMRATIYF